MKCSGASAVVSSRASNAGKAAPATTAPTMSSSDCDTHTQLAPSPIPLGAPGGGEGEGRWEGILASHLPCADGPLCPRGAKLTESEGDVVLSRPREAPSGTGSFSVSKNACGVQWSAEFWSLLGHRFER